MTVTWNSSMRVGAAVQEKFKVLSFSVKIQDLSFLIVPDNVLVEDIVLRARIFLQGENLRSTIGRRRRLCTVTFLEASLLEKLNFWCCLSSISTAIPRNRSL